MNKTKWLFLVTLLIGMMLLTACGGNTNEKSGESEPSGEAVVEQGPSGDVIVGTFGGDTVQVLEENVNPVLAKDVPDVKIVYAVGTNTERLTKLRMEKDGPSSLDIIHVNDRDMQSMINEGLLLELDFSKIPNAAKVISNFKNDYYIPYNFSANVLVYNKDKVSPAPTSWDALWDPQYKGKVGMMNNLWTDHTYIAALLEGGAYDNNWDVGWDRLKKLPAQEPVVYSSMETLGTALQTGEIWLTVTRKARAFQWETGSQEPLGNVLPQEGVYPITFCAAIPKNAKNIDGAYAYLNALLDQQPQTGFAEVMGYTPIIEGITLPENVEKNIGFSEEELKRVKPIDLDYVTKNDARWKEQWDKEIISQ